MSKKTELLSSAIAAIHTAPVADETVNDVTTIDLGFTQVDLVDMLPAPTSPVPFLAPTPLFTVDPVNFAGMTTAPLVKGAKKADDDNVKREIVLQYQKRVGTFLQVTGRDGEPRWFTASKFDHTISECGTVVTIWLSNNDLRKKGMMDKKS